MFNGLLLTSKTICQTLQERTQHVCAMNCTPMRAFLAELQDMQQELLRVAALPYKPGLK